MSDVGASGPPEPVLLTRRARTTDLPTLGMLLGDAGVAEGVSRDLLTCGAVFVLDDVASPAGHPPLGVVALRLDPPTRRAGLCGVAIRSDLRRRGLGRRLLADTATWLQAQGCEQVVGHVRPGSTGAAFLVSCGFSPVPGGEHPSEDGASADPGRVLERPVEDCRAYARDL